MALVATSSPRATAPAPSNSITMRQNVDRTIANGPGMHLNLAFSAGAPYVEAACRQVAKLLHLGPDAASKKLEAFLGDGPVRAANLDDLYTLRSGEHLPAHADSKPPKNISKTVRKLKKLCADVLKYTADSELPEERLLALKRIVMLTTRYIGLRALFLELLVSKTRTPNPTREDIVLLWSSNGDDDPEWEFVLDYAAYCVAGPDEITSVVESMKPSNFGCFEGGLCISDRLSSCIKNTLATTELLRLLAVRYLAGILEMPTFWENRLRTDFQSLIPLLCELCIRLLQDLAVDCDARGAVLVSDLVVLDPEGIHMMIYEVIQRLPEYLLAEDGSRSEAAGRLVEMLQSERSKVLFPEASKQAKTLSDKALRLREEAARKAQEDGHPSQLHHNNPRLSETSLATADESRSENAGGADELLQSESSEVLFPEASTSSDITNQAPLRQEADWNAQEHASQSSHLHSELPEDGEINDQSAAVIMARNRTPRTPLSYDARQPQTRDLTAFITRDTNFAVISHPHTEVYKGIMNDGPATTVVAIKHILPYGANPAGWNTADIRTRREIVVWKRLNHKNIVEFLGTTTNESPQRSTSMVSRWMVNGNLSTFVTPILPLAHRLQLTCDVAAGLAYLHSQDIMHGNLEAANVLIDENGVARLIDFNLSSIRSEFEGTEFVQDIIGGALRFRALEISPPVDGDYQDFNPELTFACDVYSLGSVVLQILSSLQPYHNIPSGMMIALVLARKTKPDRPVSTHLTDAYWKFIQDCWCDAPENRPSAANAHGELLRLRE